MVSKKELDMGGPYPQPFFKAGPNPLKAYQASALWIY